jgi:hypothetical protein
MFASKAVKALEAKVVAVEAGAKKEAQTLRDQIKILGVDAENRAKALEATVKALVEADAPKVADEVAKVAADLASLSVRVEAVEQSLKTEAPEVVAEVAKAVTKKASAKRTAAPEIPVEAPAEPEVPAAS